MTHGCNALRPGDRLLAPDLQAVRVVGQRGERVDGRRGGDRLDQERQRAEGEHERRGDRDDEHGGKSSTSPAPVEHPGDGVERRSTARTAR